MIGISVFALAVAVIAAAAFLGWYRDRQERLAYEATLTADDRARMRGFCAVGHSWRDFRDFEERTAARQPGTTWVPLLKAGP